MLGKDIVSGTVIGNRRVLAVFGKRRHWVLYTYEYRVADDRTGDRWHRQRIPPVGRIAANKRVV